MKSEITLVTQCKKTLICNAIVQKLNTIRQIRTVVSDRVLISTDDFSEVTLPAIQFIDLNEKIEHEQSRTKNTWLFNLELVMKGSQWESVTQQDLWNLMYLVAREMGSQPNFGIPGVIHVKYLNNQTDLHLLESHYIAKLTFEVLYYEPFVRFDC
jgi:hypothetical protein